jgi:hypothetical protein
LAEGLAEEVCLMDILVFTHGTSVMHGEAQSASREERVRQSQQRSSSVFDLSSYVPVEHAREKLWRWHDQGARIAYLGPSRRPENMEKNERMLRHLDFPPGPLHHRGPDETYAQVVERLAPDVLIEDDCGSIGGEAEMATPHMSAAGRAHTACIVVPEFGGIDHLPDDPNELVAWSQAHTDSAEQFPRRDIV